MSRNILANLVGSLWTLIMAVAFVPLYLRHIGTEGYGLLGFFASVTTVLSLLDAGLTVAAGREVARSPEGDRQAQAELQDLVHSLEVLFWSLSSLLGLTLMLLAPWFVRYWLKAETLDPEVATLSLRLMGAGFTFQLPLALYNGCLMGAQRQVKLNILSVAFSTFRSVGAALILEYGWPTLEAFFGWQLLVSAVWTAAARILLWRSLPPRSGRAAFSVDSLRRIGGFAIGVGGGNVLGILLLQFDKLVASQQLPLAELGRYTLAWTLASTLYRQTFPIFNAVYPKLVQLLTADQKPEVVRIYYRGCQAMALLLVPTALLLSLFGREIVNLWLHSQELADQIHPVLACMALGVMCNGLCHIPYALQLAHGSTRITLQTSLAAFLLMIPATLYGAHCWGGLGIALAWLVVYALLVPAMILTHWSYLPGHFAGWFFGCVVLPVCVSSLLYWPFRHGYSAFNLPANAWIQALWLGGVLGLNMAVLAGGFWAWQRFKARPPGA